MWTRCSQHPTPGESNRNSSKLKNYGMDFSSYGSLSRLLLSWLSSALCVCVCVCVCDTATASFWLLHQFVVCIASNSLSSLHAGAVEADLFLPTVYQLLIGYLVDSVAIGAWIAFFKPLLTRFPLGLGLGFWNHFSFDCRCYFLLFAAFFLAESWTLAARRRWQCS